MAWSFYDFANQPFTTIIVTFIYSAFFEKVIAPNPQIGTAMWANAIAVTAIIVAVSHQFWVPLQIMVVTESSF